ncbi:MAG TPA: hypothetical protein VM285_13765, partial [Polyangia bacterium]|nr:hypothetical protein [Polyangia bacterium]
PHRAYRFREPATAIATATGGGEIRVKSWSDERRVLELTGADGPATVRIASAPYRKWRAAQRGEELPLAAVKIGGVPAIEIRGAVNGEIELVYRDHPLEQVCFGLGILLLAACAAGLLLRPRPLPSFPPERVAVLHRALSVALAGAGILAAVALPLAGRAAVSTEWLAGQPAGTSVAGVLHRDGPRDVRFEPEDFCVRPYSRDPAWGCSEAHLAPRLAPAPPRNGKHPSCLSVGVPPRGTTRLVFRLPGGAKRVVGRLHRVEGEPVAGGSLGFDGNDRARDLAAGDRFEARIPSGSDYAVFTFSSGGKQPARTCLEAVALAD